VKIEIEDLKRFDIQLGDRFVYRSAVPLNTQEICQLRERWAAIFPHNPLMVISGNSGDELVAVRDDTKAPTA
jgi:hypothetical protein